MIIEKHHRGQYKSPCIACYYWGDITTAEAIAKTRAELPAGFLYKIFNSTADLVAMVIT